MESTDNFSIPISPKILNAIALSYKSIFRFFMEYLINSIDQANKLFFDESTNSYTKKIVISLTQIGKKASDCLFIFEDNCEGFSHRMQEHLYQYFYIGNSEKANDSKTVGKFGVGFMLFVAFFQKLKVLVKTKGWQYLDELEFDSSTFDKPGLSSVPISFNDSIPYDGDINDNFTKVILSGIKPNKFKEFSFKELISEVELHLDAVLRRKNITIKLIDNKGNVHICKPFDYDSIDCEPFVREITELNYMHYKKRRKEKIISISPASVKLYFKVTKNKIIDRRPCFTINGVRVDKVSKFEEFRANQKSYISHPNLVGYIDVTGVVEPSITRDSFEPSENLKPLFYTLNKLEPEIKHYIESELQNTTTASIKLLEVKLNDALKRFLENKKQKVKETKKIKNNNNEFENSKITLFNSNGIKSPFSSSNVKGKPNEENKKNSPNARNDSKITEIVIKTPKEDTIVLENETITENLFSLRIDDINEPDKDEFDKPYRSKFTGSEVIIYQKHPTFQSKIDNTDGIQKVTTSLITYLATEIVMHYLVNFSDFLNREESLSQKKFSDYITSVYEFEGYLKDLKGKDLTEIT